ncbi:MAG: hypothetical protein D6681_17265 [Calditrichaeota bacterium]|nr:MAG: hypothetical protein D6681_17265 [Calditrichota bacterium]
MLVWIVILSAFFLALSRFIHSETEGQFFQARERKAFYAAQSGLEYGIGRFLRSDPAQLSDWSETVDTGDSTTCEVIARLLPGNRVLIQATGHVEAYSRSLQVQIQYRNPGGGAPIQIEQIIWKYVGW